MIKAECECCGYFTVVKEYRGHGAPMKEALVFQFCEICASTHASNALQFPSQYSDVSLFQTVAYIGNMILDAINKKAEVKE